MTEHDTAHGEFLLRFLQVQDGLRAAALSLCGDPHQADDLFQETTMACWRSYDRYDPERPFGAWARGVLRNVAHAHWRKQAKAGVSLSQEAIESIVGAHAACDDSGDWRIEA
nr:sigma-70 family RNA polymerase sigma factor [Planctomycetota bacterium]